MVPLPSLQPASSPSHHDTPVSPGPVVCPAPDIVAPTVQTGGMSEVPRPHLVQVVLDAVDCRALADFYADLMGWTYREGHEPSAPGAADLDWINLRDGDRPAMAIQHVDELKPTTWPSDEVPQQMHLDMSVADVETLEAVRQRVLDLGATQRFDRSDDPEEPLYVFADPAGHLFCVFVG